MRWDQKALANLETKPECAIILPEATFFSRTGKENIAMVRKKATNLLTSVKSDPKMTRMAATLAGISERDK